MSLNWFERGIATTPTADTPPDYVAWAKRAYEHIRQQQQSEPAPAPTAEAPPPPEEAESPAPTSFLARAAALRQSRLAALKESLAPPAPAPEEAPPQPAPVPPAVELDEGFLWSAEILAAQGRKPEEVTLEEINWLQKLRQGLAKTRRNLLNQLKAIVGQGPLDERAVTELETLLLQADVGVTVTDWVIQQIQAQIRQEALPPEVALKLMGGLLRQVLERPYQQGHPRNLTPLPGQLNLWLITGVNGVGKTTTIGKLAHLATKSGYKCLIAAADTFRAAAVEQVKIWGERAGVEVISNPSPNADPAAVVFDAISAAQARGVELLLVDTAGRLQNKQNLMAELQKVRRIIDKKATNAKVESLLVLDATLGQNGLRQAQVFTEAAQLTGVILTKLDGTARGGIALAITQELGLPIRFIGAGEGMMDLRPFSSYEFVEALMGI